MPDEGPARRDCRRALERFGVWRGHLLFLGLAARVTAASDKALLEGKEGPANMSDQISK